jgi:CheY-like chemotaxis protein
MTAHLTAFDHAAAADDSSSREAVSARVLVVEDNRDVAESLKMLLELSGHRVEVVTGGAGAIEAVRAAPPEVMIVDIGLPGMNGYEVARRVRAESANGIMLVALTGYGRDDDRRAAFDAGFDHHLVKPVDPDDLDALVRRAARSRAAPA